MDQRPLVTEQIEAGTEFIDRFNERVPVRAAFWMKETDEVRWDLYVVSDKINDTTIQSFYPEVSRVTREMGNPNLDQFKVRLLGSDDPRARAAIEIHQRFAARVPTRVRDGGFGGLSVEEVYIYPPPPYGKSTKETA